MDKDTKKEFEKLGGIVKRGLKAQEKRFDQKLDNMSAMVKRGFDSVDKRFEQVDKRFEQVDKRFEQVDKRFDVIEGKIDHMDARLGRVELDVQEIKGNIVYRHEFEDLAARVKYIETKLDIVSGK